MTNIGYNNYSNIFSGLGPTPTIAKETEFISYNARWGAIDQITLNGQLTGKCLTFTQFNDAREELLQRFNKDFIPFSVLEDGNEVYKCNCASIQEISFGESKWVGIVPYSITLRCYPQDSFSGIYGILDPSEEVDFQQNENGEVNITHTVSARGFNTNSNNAFSNALGFVSSRTGWRASLSPYFINYSSGINPVLISIEERPDRFNGTYSVTETYTSDQSSNAVGLLRYSIQHNSGIQGPATVSIEGQLQGGLNKLLDAGVRTRFNNIDFYGLASNSYAGYYSVAATGLNSTPITKSISESALNNTIGFNFVYDNDPTSVVFAEYTVSFEEDQITFNVNASIQGTVRARGDRATRWPRVQNHYVNIIKKNLYDLVLAEYDNQNFKYTLNPDIISKSETYNQFDAIINFSASFGTAPIPNSAFEYMKYTLSYKPSILLFGEDPLLEKAEYYVQRLDYARREILQIDGEVKIKNEESLNKGIDRLRSQINLLIQRYSQKTKRTIDSQNIVISDNNMERIIPFQVTVSYEGQNFTV